MDEKKAKEIVEAFNKLTTFKDQMDFLKEHNKDIVICLDNDGEYIRFIDESKLEDFIEDDGVDFNDIVGIDYFGGSEGVFELFEYVGITAEGV